MLFRSSKSLGNFFLLRDILAKFPGDVVRYFLLATHYRSPIDFSDDKLTAAAKSLERIRTSYRLLLDAQKKAVSGTNRQLTESVEKARADFTAAMEDDFNTALAISVIFDFCHESNSYLAAGDISAEDVAAALALFDDFEAVLGMIIPPAQETAGLEEALLDLIIKIRGEARAKKDWATADAIRDGLKELGIAIEDTADGARWKRI